MKSVGFVVKLHVIVNYLKIMTSISQCFYSKCTWPATMQIIHISFSKKLYTKYENKSVLKCIYYIIIVVNLLHVSAPKKCRRLITIIM